ncbi:twin arginine-targeting protein translocase TatC [Ochromonadaceae sp. CCMP2298]|nr:twin arginine-targeting protein translocase TatC [Ochromonadaceae sp. CCMP2298]
MALDQIGDGNEGEMSFLEHLESLRWHLIRALIAIVIVTIAAFIAADFVIDTVLFGPSRVDFWTYRKMMASQFMTHITVSFVAGLIIGFPYAFWEIWRFIKPGLHSAEKKASRGATFSVSLLFLLGILFGYFLIAPISIRFFATYQISTVLENKFDLSSYVSTVTMIVFGSGLLFQLPVIVFFLTKAGLISSHLMKTYRKHAIIVILVLGAMITPPDPFSQILIALPLMVLYQISIVIAKRIEKRKAE